MPRCSDVMTNNPVCCLPGDPVNKLGQLMAGRDIGPVLIVENDQTKQLAGIVTDRDLAVRVVAAGRDPMATMAADIMSRNVKTVQAEDDLQRALDMMAEHQLRRIPVVDNNNRIVGILAQADIATRVNQPQQTAEVVKNISQARHAARPMGGSATS